MTIQSEQTEAAVKSEFRNYVDSARQATVQQFYRENHIKQTMEFVQQQRESHLKFDKMQMGIWEAALLLNEVMDDSDPDTEYPQIIHLLQTAESMRLAYPGEEYDWLHLAAFIHDLGKVLAHPKFGSQPQWAVVGDTFPVGCQHSSKIVFPQFFEENCDSTNPLYNTPTGIYKDGIGIDNLIMSWGHDEYLYQVCKANGSTLPDHALNIIRFHSFYSWHTAGQYTHLMEEKDQETLHWVKEFQRHDLYSKLPEKPSLEKLTPYYQGLIAKYFPTVLRW